MPFLAPLIPAIVSGIAAAGTGAAVNAVGNALSGNKGPQSVPLDKSVNDRQVREANQDAYGAQSQQQQLANQLAAQGGIQNQSSVYNQQQQLANQLGAMAQGQGPSVATAQLNNATGANVANQAALMAGQRGAGANAGLIARQAAQQGGALQQQAAGQGAVLKQQEQLNAIGALQNQQGMLGNLATTQVGQQSSAIGNLNQIAQARANSLMSQQNNQNQLALGQQQGIDKLNNETGLQNSRNQLDLTKGVASGLGSTLASGVSKGLGIKMAEGGPVPANSSNQSAALKEGGYKGRSRIGAQLGGFAQGGQISMVGGGHVPGTPVVPGAKDSYANDIVDAKLSPGEIVLPRSVTMSDDPAAAAARFVAALKSKSGRK